MIKKRVSVYFLISLLLLVFVYCGGGKQEPIKMEPASPLERTPKTDGPAAPVEKPAQPAEPQEKPLERPEELEITEIHEEKPPVPKKNQSLILPKTEETPKTEVVPDSIMDGMIAIFRGYGYDGAIELPENFKRRVAYYIRYFSENEKGARFFRRAMERSEQFLPMIRDVLEKKKLPLTLAYLPLIESGFNPNAHSRAKAVGLWQFMKGTAIMYGLKVNRKIDQRKDPIQSTIAAAEYINDLLAMFGAEDPFLGICAYNAGEGKILRALRTISYTERSFWTLVKKGILQVETNEYIPRLLAVTLMASEPTKYLAASKSIPLEMKPEEAENEDQEVLNSLPSSKDDLEEATTTAEPEDKPGEEINTAASAEEETPLETTTPITTTPTIYKVKRGDTMYSIAKRFNVTVKQVKKWNSLRDNRIHVGQSLKISASQVTAVEPKTPAIKAKGKFHIIYTVNYSDWLARIALFFDGVTTRDIMVWNGLRHSRIQPGQKLKLFLKKAPRKIREHIVRRGETAKTIAKKYGVRIEFVLSLNGLLTNSKLKPGMRLKIYLF